MTTEEAGALLPPLGTVECPECKGSGYSWSTVMDSGKRVGADCDRCDGSGEVPAAPPAICLCPPCITPDGSDNAMGATKEADGDDTREIRSED